MSTQIGSSGYPPQKVKALPSSLECFKKLKSGHPRVGQSFPEIFKRLLNEKKEALHGKQTWKALLCRRIVEQAEKGDMRAVEFIADRMEGKALQAFVGEVTTNQPPVINVISQTASDEVQRIINGG